MSHSTQNNHLGMFFSANLLD